MCGIIGVVSRPSRFSKAEIANAVESLRHRGPDAVAVEKVHRSECWDVWFGHTRLSILDLSESGNQPMTGSRSDGRRGTIVFNGEVFNHRELRRELESEWDFQSNSDTEVLLAGMLESSTKFLHEMNSMMAFGFLDHQSGILTLARDRLGKKPLFVYRSSDILAFASELKAFHALGLPLSEDDVGWAHYHWHRHLPAERSIYKEVSKFPAGSFATLDLNEGSLDLQPLPFWDAFQACGRSFDGDYEDAIEEFFRLLDDATSLRLDADVPVGLFLSAGIDSTLVASSVSRQHNSSVTAFVIQAASPEFDESVEAQRTAETLGLQCEVIPLHLQDYYRQMDSMAYYYDEPCAPPSQIATMAVAEAASRHVKVVLTGDGGDEIFLGYPWLSHPGKLWKYRSALESVPGLAPLARTVLQSPLGSIGLRLIARLLSLNSRDVVLKKQLALDLLQVSEPGILYEHFLQIWPRELLDPVWKELLGPGAMLERAKSAYPSYNWEAAANRSLEETLGAFEMVTAMRDEILVKVDRATMAYSLEARSPLLDYRIVEFGMSLPSSFKRDGGVYKRILRDACARRVSKSLSRRAKSGFGIPLPPDLPSGPSDLVRWAREFERRWALEWRQS